MVSKPNPYADEEIRQRLYASYQRQMPMWDHPGDFNIGKPLVDSLGMGCYNCNAAFKLGSGRSGAKYFYNAYDAPSQFFYLPYKMHGMYTPYDIKGGKRRKPKAKKDYYDSNRLREEASTDWYGLVKELVPIGFKIGDIIKIFYDKFAGKYGEGLLDEMMNIEQFRHEAGDVGYNAYM